MLYFFSLSLFCFNFVQGHKQMQNFARFFFLKKKTWVPKHIEKSRDMMICSESETNFKFCTLDIFSFHCNRSAHIVSNKRTVCYVCAVPTMQNCIALFIQFTIYPINKGPRAKVPHCIRGSIPTILHLYLGHASCQLPTS